MWLEGRCAGERRVPPDANRGLGVGPCDHPAWGYVSRRAGPCGISAELVGSRRTPFPHPWNGSVACSPLVATGWPGLGLLDVLPAAHRLTTL